jgi:predicted Zn-ribbon and HTH transcriptional regulator
MPQFQEEYQSLKHLSVTLDHVSTRVLLNYAHSCSNLCFFSFFQQKFEPEGPCPRTHEEDAGHNRRLFLLHTE